MEHGSPTDLFHQIRACPPERYQKLDLSGLIAFTIRWLLDHDVPTTFENIVVSAFRMFPEKFAMVGFAEYPDAARVNRSLLQLGPKYRNWARGSVQKGFVLTESGAAKVSEVAATLEKPYERDAPKPEPRARPRTADTEGELRRIASSVLFRKWADGHLADATVLDLLDMLGAYAYTPPRALRKRIAELRASAAHLGKDELSEFLAQVRRVFATTFVDQ
jgi:hypothetical protein